MSGPAARYASLSEFPDREIMDPRIRLRRGLQTIRLALRLLALSSRKAGHTVSRHPFHDGGHRHSRRSHARQKNGCPDASRSRQRPKPRAPHPSEDRNQSRPRRRQTHHQADRGRHGYLFVLVLAVRSETVASLGSKKTEGAPSFAVSEGWEPRHPTSSQLRFVGFALLTRLPNMVDSKPVRHLLRTPSQT